MKDVTLGQYYPVASAIHRLDPRTKILSTILLVVLTFICGTFAGLAVCLAAILAFTFLAHIPLKKLLGSLKAIFVLLLFTAVLNMFFYQSGKVLFSWWILTLTVGGIKHAAFMALRLSLLVAGAGLLTFTTSPIELTDGLERLMSPLRKIGFPAHEIAMMLSIALRFIPILSDETDKIMKAQSARGAVFDEGSLFKRARAIVALLIPLLVSAFRRADELAMAMEARCYHGGDGRTRLKVLAFGKNDLTAAIVMLLFCGLIIVDRALLTRLLPFLAG